MTAAALAAVWLVEQAGPGEDVGPATTDVISDYDAQIDRLLRERAAAEQSTSAATYDATIERLLRERRPDSAVTYDATIERLLRERAVTGEDSVDGTHDAIIDRLLREREGADTTR